MPKILTLAVVAGLISGLLVGGFHNLFTVPVIERAIALEEAGDMAHGDPLAPAEPPLVSLGAQRVGMAVGTAIYGVILGLLFTGGYALTRRAFPSWGPLALALTTGALGFWALSLLPFIKFPLNPPGVGEESSLLYRQAFQTLTIVLSVAAVVASLIAIRRINALPKAAWPRLYAFVGAGYVAFVALLLLLMPSNPDPVNAPIDLLQLFRVLTMAGQFLQWMLLAAGVGVAVILFQRAQERANRPANLRPRVAPR